MPEFSPEHWAQAEALFVRALDVNREERDAFCRLECPVDEVRLEVVSLLEFDGEHLIGPAIEESAVR